MGWVGYTTSLTKIYVSQNSTLASFSPDPGSSPEMKYSGGTRAQSDLLVSDFEDLDFKAAAQWCRTKPRSKKTYHWRFIHHLKRLCGTFRKQLTKKYGTGIFWNPGKIWHFWCFLAFFGVFGCHFHSAVLFPRVFGTAYDIYPPQTSA